MRVGDVPIDRGIVPLLSAFAVSDRHQESERAGASADEFVQFYNLPRDAVQLIDTIDRNAVGRLVAMPEFVDIVVPRGGKGLIERLMRESRVPMIKHLDGICHVYIDSGADLDMAVALAARSNFERLTVEQRAPRGRVKLPTDTTGISVTCPIFRP